MILKTWPPWFSPLSYNFFKNKTDKKRKRNESIKNKKMAMAIVCLFLSGLFEINSLVINGETRPSAKAINRIKMIDFGIVISKNSTRSWNKLVLNLFQYSGWQYKKIPSKQKTRHRGEAFRPLCKFPCITQDTPPNDGFSMSCVIAPCPKNGFRRLIVYPNNNANPNKPQDFVSSYSFVLS